MILFIHKTTAPPLSLIRSFSFVFDYLSFSEPILLKNFLAHFYKFGFKFHSRSHGISIYLIFVKEFTFNLFNPVYLMAPLSVFLFLS